MNLKSTGTTNIKIAENFIEKSMIIKTLIGHPLVKSQRTKEVHADTWLKISIT